MKCGSKNTAREEEAFEKARSQEDLSTNALAARPTSWPSNPALSSMELGGGEAQIHREKSCIGGESMGSGHQIIGSCEEVGYGEVAVIKDTPLTQSSISIPPTIGPSTPTSIIGTNNKNKVASTLKKWFGSNPNLTEETSGLSPILNSSALDLSKQSLTPAGGREINKINKFTSSTPNKKEFILVSGVRVKNVNLFQIENNFGYMLRDKLNRRSTFLRWDGQLDLTNVKFRKFTDYLISYIPDWGIWLLKLTQMVLTTFFG